MYDLKSRFRIKISASRFSKGKRLVTEVFNFETENFHSLNGPVMKKNFFIEMF